MRRFSAVVCERSSHDQYDKIAQDRSCIEHTVRKLKGLIGPDGDDASAEGLGEESSDDESGNQEAERLGNASQRGDNGVSEIKDTKEEDAVASSDEDAQIERIGVKTGNH